ncbi:MAG: helix-turn-helix transcriptional regulator [Verrucomicrobiae bacterium]|nr:helix-turn-helix transcriptional regulator [Verrucomicrobiae bacterium]
MEHHLGRKLKFGEALRKLRGSQRDADGRPLSLRGLAGRAKMNHSFIAGIESGNRNAGEISLRKLANALGLSPDETEAFVEEGLSAAGSKQVLDNFKDFPTAFLHVLAREILSAYPEMDPGKIEDVLWRGGGLKASEADLLWRIGDHWFAAEISVSCGNCPSAAFANLKRKLSRRDRGKEKKHHA